ncbi:hypothetical protein [Tomitella gaofuii]|uniref:hypothetical protein n=1 Tax=Tomitella gaofuii TaxID=2760083 RepID=UPI0015FCBAED|nr:hypothetical protein [Tomitella gaofuii]
MPVTSDRKEGHQTALAAATKAHSYLPEVESAFNRLINAGGYFTADDLRDAVSPVARQWMRDNSASIGALFTHAVNADRINAAGFIPSRRAERRGNPIRIWKGTH